MSLKNLPPLNVEVLRGENVESRHDVSAVVINSSGVTELAFGLSDLRIYPRSSIKAIQALPIILSGAAQKFSISDTELAMASASHGAEAAHISCVESWLHRIGLSIQDLECGSHLPGNQQAAFQLLNSGRTFSAIHNNCSGKHTGMLSMALAMGVDTGGYSGVNHPVQQQIRRVIEDYCSERITADCIAVDGCSIPTYFLHLTSLALAMARFSDPENFMPLYDSAAKRIYRANVENPFYVAGTDRYCTRIMTELNKRGLVKTGAEGVMFAGIPELKIGVVIKVHDGNLRASEVAMSWILNELGLLSPAAWEQYSQIPVKNWNQILTGKIQIKL